MSCDDRAQGLVSGVWAQGSASGVWAKFQLSFSQDP